jgi:2,3-bisphosphoglycerate-independent phosphoglycerate mutase
VKYLIVIPDGSADKPVDSLGGRTPLEAARTFHMDRIAAAGVIGTVRTVPKGYKPGSDVAIMSAVGYAPERYYTGRAPLEAAARDIELAPGDWAVRCNLVTLSGGRMADYSAGHITDAEAAEIVKSLNEAFGGEGCEFYPSKAYRNILVMRGAGDMEVETTPPHDIAGREYGDYLPGGADSERFGKLMERSREVLAGHEVNARRRERGLNEATSIWLWGEGGAAEFDSFRGRYGLDAAVITAVDLVAGICRLAGWQRIVVPGATGYYDTDYDGKREAAERGLEEFDLVLVHVEAPDEASHNLDVDNKIRAIESIDARVVGPLAEAVSAMGDHRILVMSDHYTLVSTGAHDGTPVPFAVSGTGIASSGAKAFNEREAEAGVALEEGWRLMDMLTGDKDSWVS